jgi:hypothetical protein
LELTPKTEVYISGPSLPRPIRLTGISFLNSKIIVHQIIRKRVEKVSKSFLKLLRSKSQVMITVILPGQFRILSLHQSEIPQTPPDNLNIHNVPPQTKKPDHATLSARAIRNLHS